LRDEREAAVALGIEIAARRETHLIGSDGPQSVEVCELFAEPPHRLGLTQTASATLGGLARKRVLRLGSRDGPAQLRLRDSVLADPLDLGQNFSLGTREVRGLELRGDGDDAAGLERGIVAADRVDQREPFPERLGKSRRPRPASPRRACQRGRASGRAIRHRGTPALPAAEPPASSGRGSPRSSPVNARVRFAAAVPACAQPS